MECSMNKPIEGYMCKTDFDFELGIASDGIEVYSSIEDLKEWRPCVEGCGIVKVEVRLVEVIQPENFEDEE